MYIYCDASFSNKHKFGVAGFIIFKDDVSHGNNDFKAAVIKTVKINEKNNIRTEVKGVILALEMLKEGFLEDDFNITLFTDCNTVINLSERRAYLEANHYISKSSGVVLANADVYKEYFKLFDELKPKLIWVKGHMPQKEHDAIQKNFSFIDRLVRSELRRSI